VTEPSLDLGGTMGNQMLGRYGTPEEVVNMITFLASDEAGACTGGVYTVDGGISAY